MLGFAFLVVKGFEYRKDLHDRLLPGTHFDSSLPPPTQIFFWLYWVMTGLHGIHVTVGIGILAVMFLLARRGKFSGTYYTPVELAGLYWHFVDIVWLFCIHCFISSNATHESKPPIQKNFRVDVDSARHFAFHDSRHRLLPEISDTPLIATLVFVQMMLIILFFMEVRYASKLIWMFAAAGFFWLCIQFVLAASDYLTRSWH